MRVWLACSACLAFGTSAFAQPLSRVALEETSPAVEAVVEASSLPECSSLDARRAPGIAGSEATSELAERLEYDLDSNLGRLAGAEAEERLSQVALEEEPEWSEDVEPVDLPSGTEAGTPTTQSVPLPTGEGSIEGMGESFTPSLSAGTGTYAVPLAMPGGRGGLSPSVALSYSTGAGNGPVGIGWGIGNACIHRQSDRGLPGYVDAPAWHPLEDRFVYDGAHELVPVDGDEVAAIDGGIVPAELAGWQQYRARIEGGFHRFFRSPDGTRWVVQSPTGGRTDLGQLPAGDGPPGMVDASVHALQSEHDDGTGRIFAWCTSRTSDALGNVVYYRYRAYLGARYLDDIHYVSPASCADEGDPVARRRCAAPLSDYLHHVRFVYEERPDVFDAYTTTWRVTTAWRLARVEVTSALGLPGSRALGWRYRLGYDPARFHSLLSFLQLEGRPSRFDDETQVYLGETDVTEGSFDASVVGDLYPPMRFRYSQTDATSTEAPGFGGFDARVHHAPTSPSVSLDTANVSLFDVNSDGLLDVIETNPARHRREGGPAMGVFFNGFVGADARPAVAGGFSDPVPVGVPQGLSAEARLQNPNFVPMDADGDGRGDFLHMPRVRSYGYLTPTRSPEASEVHPSAQDWTFVHVPAVLPEGFTDPRVDFQRDAVRIRTLDVNNDHLVDVVRTTGTGMQTWLNLGWLPEGDGRFGSASFDGSSWTLSPEPIESCLLHDGRPFDFADPDAHTADMNGDGLVDLVRLAHGRVAYWPGRGVGAWGDGPARCDANTFAGDRHVEMASPPRELNAELAGVMLLDANADGAADVVQVRFDAVDVWYSRAGRGFTERVSARTPFAPAFLSRVTTADLDGSGTTDLVYGEADDWRWLSLVGTRRPRLLEEIDNGLGGRTTLEYGSSSEDYLRDLRALAECPDCEGFSWSATPGGCDQKLEARAGVCAYRSGSSPFVSTVVRATELTDRFDEVGREANVVRSEYAYHDAYYEGIEQEFRGFGAADVVALGDVTTPTSVQRTYFLQGRRPASLASDRLADNPNEALKGRAFFTETSDTEGTYLSTTHSAWAVRHLVDGLDGRAVSYAYAFQSDALAYDTAPFAPLETSLQVPALRFEHAGGAAATVEERTITVRGDRWAHVRDTVDVVDDLGHPLQQTSHGRIRGEFGETPSEAITSHVVVVRLDDPTGWRFVSTASWIDGEGGVPLGLTTITYDPATGLPLRRETVASLATTIPFEFGGDDDSAGYVQTDQTMVASTRYDVWGAPVATCAGADLHVAEHDCLRYSEVDYDADYSTYPEVERIAVDRAGGAWTFLTTTGVWDRGRGVIVSATEPNGQVTEIGLDGLGRPTFVRGPPSVGCEGSTVPSTRIEYAFAEYDLPVSRVRTTSELSCVAVGADALVTTEYFDGLGRTRATLTEGGEEHAWVVSGHQVLDARGGVARAYQPDFLDVAAPSAATVLALPPVPFVRSARDAFGRDRQQWAEDGQLVAEVRHHALSQDTCDANDVDPASPHYDTCVTTRVDGHGRTIDRVLRNRQPGLLDVEYHRLFTRYRNDGAVVEVRRAQTATDTPLPGALADVVDGRSVVRTFALDTVGRRLSSSDPDTDSRYAAATDANRSWRYLYNHIGDLVAVRDPRGCGQNFYFDRVGRLLGEAYVRCSEAQSSGELSDDTVPAGAIALGPIAASAYVEARTWYDAYPEWAVGELAPPGGPTLGRMTASANRSARAVVAYDVRGNGVWSAKQIALLPQAALAPTSLGTADAPVVEPVTASPRVYDTSHTYVRTASFDFANRPADMALPVDPDWELLGGTGAAPTIGGRLRFDARGFIAGADLTIDGVSRPVVASTAYTRDGLVREVVYGDDDEGARPPTTSIATYDVRRRPVAMHTERAPTAFGTAALADVSVVAHDRLVWDGAGNLEAIHDLRPASEWPEGYRPQTARITHDALYRVAGVDFEYRTELGATYLDVPSDWRASLHATNADGQSHRTADPMRTDPAPMVAALPEARVVNLTYETDWLANVVEWTDDAASFYERSLGEITNGSLADGDRPAALRLATNLPEAQTAGDDLGGYVTVDYGQNGNVVAMTVHARCADAPARACVDDRDAALQTRRDALLLNCVCANEQHYQYLWDEVGRLSEARRYDRSGDGAWSLAARQRYGYGAGFERVIKQTDDLGGGAPRATLYVHPGDYERRGLVANAETETWDASLALGTETQYLVAGARVVWKASESAGALDRNHRITVPITNIIGTTAAVLELESGELVEASTYYPNGARETLRVQSDESSATEPAGFTGKEADEEVGVVYFGARYLIPRLGRWASADPLEVHALGGGEIGNSYHYVGGNLLRGRDPVGLNDKSGRGWVMTPNGEGAHMPP
ncbi:MAG: hypothetical protein H6721_20995, partial [Sandaracinus sp.]|nr:hypothetical protein [Sandaracinus sp.]